LLEFGPEESTLMSTNFLAGSRTKFDWELMEFLQAKIKKLFCCWLQKRTLSRAINTSSETYPERMMFYMDGGGGARRSFLLKNGSKLFSLKMWRCQNAEVSSSR
jgi:hypothetical protein